MLHVIHVHLYRCGSGMEGLNKQGNANAVFSQMIQNYSFIFEVSNIIILCNHTEGVLGFPQFQSLIM